MYVPVGMRNMFLSNNRVASSIAFNLTSTFSLEQPQSLRLCYSQWPVCELFHDPVFRGSRSLLSSDQVHSGRCASQIIVSPNGRDGIIDGGSEIRSDSDVRIERVKLMRRVCIFVRGSRSKWLARGRLINKPEIEKVHMKGFEATASKFINKLFPQEQLCVVGESLHRN